MKVLLIATLLTLACADTSNSTDGVAITHNFYDSIGGVCTCCNGTTLVHTNQSCVCSGLTEPHGKVCRGLTNFAECGTSNNACPDDLLCVKFVPFTSVCLELNPSHCYETQILCMKQCQQLLMGQADVFCEHTCNINLLACVINTIPTCATKNDCQGAPCINGRCAPPVLRIAPMSTCVDNLTTCGCTATTCPQNCIDAFLVCARGVARSCEAAVKPAFFGCNLLAPGTCADLATALYYGCVTNGFS